MGGIESWKSCGIGGASIRIARVCVSRSDRHRGCEDSRPGFSPSSSSTSFIPLPVPSPFFLSTLLGLASIEVAPRQNMDTQRQSRLYNQPSLHLVTSPTPAQPISTRVQNHKQSESPFRYLNERLADGQVFNEKDQTPLADISSSSGRRARSNSRATHRTSPSTSRSSTPVSAHHRTHSRQLSQHTRPTAPTPQPPNADNGRERPPRRIGQLERPFSTSLSTRLQPWVPIILYGISSLGFVVAIAFWRTEIFQGMVSMASVSCLRS